MGWYSDSQKSKAYQDFRTEESNFTTKKPKRNVSKGQLRKLAEKTSKETRRANDSNSRCEGIVNERGDRCTNKRQDVYPLCKRCENNPIARAVCFTDWND
jgi:hypothetical protein